MEGVDWVPVIAGAVLLLGGFLLYFLSLWMAGGIIAGAIGFLIGQGTGRLLQWEPGPVLFLSLALAGLGLLIGAATAHFLHKVAFFTLGFLAGAAAFFSVGPALLAALGMEGDQAFYLAVGVPLAGLAVGILATLLDKFLLALATSLVGAGLIMEGVDWRWGVLPYIPLVVLGLAFQFGLARSRKAQERTEDE